MGHLNNLREFERIEGLRIESWVEPNASCESGRSEE